MEHVERFFSVERIRRLGQMEPGADVPLAIRAVRLVTLLSLGGVFFLLVSCNCDLPKPAPLQGIQLTTLGNAFNPRMASNGPDFAIIYSRFSASGWYSDIDIMKVDREGRILIGPDRVIGVPYDPSFWYDRFLVSDLVWNALDGQFAFAYSHGKEIYFTRFDSDLHQICGPCFTRIHFPGLIEEQHPHLVDVSLVWNTVLKEYGVAFVTREDPYDEDRHDDIYLSRIAADGTFVGPLGRAFHAIDCPGDCYRTSLAHNRNGDYAIAYIKGIIGPPHDHWAMIAFVNRNNEVREHHILSGGFLFGSPPIRLHYDMLEDEYLVVARDSTKNLASQVVQPDGSASAMVRRSSEHPYVDDYTIDDLLCAAHSYQICVTTGGQIHCWIATASQHNPEDLISPPDNTGRHPYLHGKYLSWVEEGNVFFGRIWE